MAAIGEGHGLACAAQGSGADAVQGLWGEGRLASAGTIAASAHQQAAPSRRVLSSDEAAAAVRRGIVRAAADCELWSNDWPSDRGCENLIQVRATEELHKVLSANRLGWVTLEEPISNVSWAGTSKRGRRFVGMRDTQRADVAVWSRSDNIYGLVEIKRSEDARGWRADLEKLSRLLCTYGRNNENHLRFGVLGAYLSGPNKLTVKNKVARLKLVAAEVAEQFKLLQRTSFDDGGVHYFQGGDDDGWTCGAATVQLRIPTWR